MLDSESHSDPITACRRDMAAMAATWRVVSARSEPKARAEAEAQVFNQMVVALDSRFDDRPRAEAGALTEVRLLAQGISHRNGWFPVEGADWRPEDSITGYAPGDRIRLDEATFSRLAGAYLDAVAEAIAGEP